MRITIALPGVLSALLVLGALPAGAQELVKGLKKPYMVRLTSPAFSDKGTIPAKYTCDGEGIRPPLEWTDLPEGTKFLVITIDDGSNRKAFWSQWAAYNIPGDLKGLAEGAPLPAGAKEGVSDWGKPGYDPPCPKKGKRDYLITIYALNKPVDRPLGDKPSRSDILNATDRKVLGWGRLFFNYERAQPKP